VFGGPYVAEGRTLPRPDLYGFKGWEVIHYDILGAGAFEDHFVVYVVCMSVKCANI